MKHYLDLETPTTQIESFLLKNGIDIGTELPNDATSIKSVPYKNKLFKRLILIDFSFSCSWSVGQSICPGTHGNVFT